MSTGGFRAQWENQHNWQGPGWLADKPLLVVGRWLVQWASAQYGSQKGSCSHVHAGLRWHSDPYNVTELGVWVGLVNWGVAL